MSFSFRNIFSPDEENFESSSAGWQLPGTSASTESGRGNPNPAQSRAADGGQYFQSFLISELIAYIPTAISAPSGIPMHKEVTVPIPGDGSRDVKLSTLYRVCPELFAAEITALNDSVITLPPKLGGTSPTAAQTTGFGLGTTWSGAEAPSNNPFWAPNQKNDDVGEEAKRNGLKDEKPLASQEDVAQWLKGPIGGETPLFTQSAPQQSQPKGNAHSATGSDGGPGGFGDSAFQGKPPANLKGAGGMQPPKNGEFDKGGQSFSGNPFESEQGFSTLFSKQAALDSELPFPTGSVPNNLKEEPEGVWGAMFHGGEITPDEQGIEKEVTPFSPPSFENIGNLLKQGVNDSKTLPASEFSVHPNAASSSTFTPMSNPIQMSPAQEFSAFQAAAPANQSPAPLPGPNGLQVSWTTEPKTKPELSPLPASGAGSSGFNSFGQTPPLAAKGTEAGHPMASVIPGAPGGSHLNESNALKSFPKMPSVASMEDHGADRDLELCAIFSLSEKFTLSMVARCVVDLPGIISCSLTTPGKLVQASRSEEGKIGSEAREMISTIRNLAKLTGLPEARTFTLHTDRGIVSLFLEGEYCVTVHHEKATFQPGIREKLIVVARNLIKLGE